MTDKPVRRYNFGASKGLGTGLSAIANKMWDQGKQEYAGQTNAPIVLERKGLSDVLGKMKKDQGQSIIPDSSSTDAEKPAYVFGQKLAERVVEPTHDSEKTKTTDFKTAAAGERKTTIGDNDGSNGTTTATTAERLKADAEAYSKEQEEKDSIASTSVIDVKTGEENDSTIHQFSCKIHSFDAAKKQWVERGLSSLKINRIGEADDVAWTRDGSPPADAYRIVARTFGTMKLIINSPVFADMVIEKMDERRIKMTAVAADGGPPQIFLLTLNLAKTDTVAEGVYTALRETRDLVKREEERTGGGGAGEEKRSMKRKREEEKKEEGGEAEEEESVPEAKKAAADAAAAAAEDDEAADAAEEEEEESAAEEKQDEAGERDVSADYEDEKSLDASQVSIKDDESTVATQPIEN